MFESVPEHADHVPLPAPPSPYFSGWITLLATLLVAALLGLFTWPLSSSPLLGLDRPEESLERLVSSELDLRAALQHAPTWEVALYALLAGSSDPIEESIVWYEELTETLDAPRAEIYRHILMAEAGRPARASPALASAEWMGAAYGEAPIEADAGRTVIAEIRERLPENWFADTLVARVAARIDDRASQAQAESASAARGASLLRRLRVLGAGQGLLLALGLAGLAAVLTRRAPVAVGAASVPPTWPFGDGYALFIRGVAGLLGVGIAAGALLPEGSALLHLAGVASGIPMLWWTIRYLSVRGRGPAAAFGLRLIADGGSGLVTAICVVIALGIAGDGIITVVAGTLGLHTHWADGFPEEILWDPGWRLVIGTIDGGLWTPVVEEIAFRGVLYATLRRVMRVTPAVLCSAAIFAAAHGYGPVGFTSALWSGILWAAAYERTKSLLPGILAHAVNNLMVTVTYLWLYRAS